MDRRDVRQRRMVRASLSEVRVRAWETTVSLVLAESQRRVEIGQSRIEVKTEVVKYETAGRPLRCW